ncbi:MAG: deoxyribose-phosphate aldolase [Clostridia bacterium]|nr:deoxyribose-phosphate aldolase [Clostridia bacterium]
MKRRSILSKIDSTLLKQTATGEQICALCENAINNGFAAVCVQPCYVSLCAKWLNGSSVRVATVIGFPMGANTTEVKAFEAQNAVKNGADELDMVINIGLAMEGKWDLVKEDIAAVVRASEGRCVKVIIETCFLSDEQVVAACNAAMEAGAQFVKTSTGMAQGGATVHHVSLIKSTVGDRCLVKAAGGIRTFEDCEKFVEAGADRIGTGSGAAIAEQ